MAGSFSAVPNYLHINTAYYYYDCFISCPVTGGIFGIIVAVCQVEVVVVAIAIAIVNFVTKKFVKWNFILSQNRSENTRELGSVKADYALYEPVGLDGSILVTL